MGLDEGKGLKKLVHGAKTTWQHDKSLRIFDKHELTHKEVVEVDELIPVDIRIAELLKGQVDVEAYRFATGELGAFITGFHDARTAARDYAVAFVVIRSESPG